MNEKLRKIKKTKFYLECQDEFIHGDIEHTFTLLESIGKKRYINHGCIILNKKSIDFINEYITGIRGDGFPSNGMEMKSLNFKDISKLTI